MEAFRCFAQSNSSMVSILLWLFLHLILFVFFSTSFRTLCRTGMADVIQTQKMIPFIRCEIPRLACLRVGFWCQCIWFEFLGPKWFDRTTNQAQFCEFWKRVSLPDFFPFWSSWSLLRCLQTHTTKLLDAKIGRLREQSQHYPNHWSHSQIAYARDSCEGKQRVSPFYNGSESCFQGLKQSDPMNQEREYRLISVPCSER